MYHDPVPSRYMHSYRYACTYTHIHKFMHMFICTIIPVTYTQTHTQNMVMKLIDNTKGLFLNIKLTQAGLELLL